MTDESSATSVPPPPPPPLPGEPLIYAGQYIVPEGYGKSAAAAFQRFNLTRPASIVFYVILGLVIVGDILAYAVDHLTVTYTTVFPPVIIVLLILSNLSQYRGLARRLGASSPAGATYAVTLTESTMSITTPTAAATTRFDSYDRLDTSGDFLLFKTRGARFRNIVPRGLFTDEWVTWLHTKIGQR